MKEIYLERQKYLQQNFLKKVYISSSSINNISGF